MFSSDELVVDQCIINKFVAIQIKGSGVHGNEFWHVGVLAVAALNYVGGPSLVMKAVAAV